MNSRNKVLVAASSAAALLGGISTQANAALSTEIGTGLTGIQTDALALVDLIWPVVVAVTSAFIIFKLFKRGVSKV